MPTCRSVLAFSQLFKANRPKMTFWPFRFGPIYLVMANLFSCRSFGQRSFRSFSVGSTRIHQNGDKKGSRARTRGAGLACATAAWRLMVRRVRRSQDYMEMRPEDLDAKVKAQEELTATADRDRHGEGVCAAVGAPVCLGLAPVCLFSPRESIALFGSWAKKPGGGRKNSEVMLTPD